MSLLLNKAWLPLNEAMLRSIPGQLGVFELGDDDQQVCYVGVAAGKSLFGLRSEIQTHIGRAPYVRFEVNTAYRTRHRELLMAHFAYSGCYPLFNTENETAGLGRLSLIVGAH